MAKLRDRRGMVLLEGVVAMFVFAIAIIGVVSMLASAYRLDAYDLTPQEEAAKSVEDVRQALRNYVTADHDEALAEFAPLATGPGRELDRAHYHWRLPGDTCRHAFEPGCTHNATAFLSESFRVRMATACLTYEVGPEPAVPDQPLPVRFRVGWLDTAKVCVDHAL